MHPSMVSRASNVSGVFRGLLEQIAEATYEFAEMATHNIVPCMSTLESTFGRSGGMLQEVLGTSLRGF